jgi:membrane protease YdiL (CAAX protease family)
MTLFAFLALALAICSLGVLLRIEPRQRQNHTDANRNHLVDSSLTSTSLKVISLAATSLAAIKFTVPLRLPVCSLGFATFALVLALLASLLTTGAALWCVLSLLLALWLNTSQASAISRSLGFILLALLALAGALHLVPGFANPLLVNAQLLTPDAIPYTLYANFDKGWAGYCLLLAIWPSQNQNQIARPVLIARQSHSQHLASLYWRGFWPVWPLTVLAALGLALCLQLLQFAPKWPDFALQFIFCNLLLTCVAEEAFFRGLLQRPLYQWLSQRWFGSNQAAWCAIVVVSNLFGLAHFAGGWAYALVATVASVGYGWAYQRSGRIEVAIVAHAALNVVHMTLFTYPMLR